MSRSKCRPLQEKASPAPDKTKPLTRNKGAWVIGFNGGRSVRSIRAKVGVLLCLPDCLSLKREFVGSLPLGNIKDKKLHTEFYASSSVPHRSVYTILCLVNVYSIQSNRNAVERGPMMASVAPTYTRNTSNSR